MTPTTQKELDRLFNTAKTRTSPSMRKAIKLIFLNGMTWREASIRCGVTESGILRAMRRLMR